MFEELNNRRKAVEQNIIKSFVEENDIEKAREKKTFSIGDTFTRHGITYRCTGISPNTGRPTWSKVGGGAEKPKEEEKQKTPKLEIVSTATYVYAKDKDGNLYVLAGRRGSTAPTGANKLNPPMGMIDYGETPEESAIREIEEETGLKIKKTDLVDNGEEEYANRKGIGGKNYSIMLSGDITEYKIGEGDGENSKFKWVKVEDIEDNDWAFGTGSTAKKFKPKKETKQMGKLSDLQVGDEVEIVEDNKGKITKKKGKITKVNAASFEVGGERFYKRTGYHVGMDNVKIQIPK